MRISHVDIENFRCVRKLSLPLSPFVCIVGPNNAGKSSVLTAISLFVNGTKLGQSDFYDQGQDIVITATLADVADADLAALDEQARVRIKELVVDGRLTLVRRYDREKFTSALRCLRKVPKDPRFQPDSVDTVLANRKGAAQYRAAVLAEFPELDGRLEGLTTKVQFADAIQKLAQSQPDDQTMLGEMPLPTGIDNSIIRLLPEPLLIPAIKDVSDEVKTKEAASFGRILRLMMDSIIASERMQAVNDSFESLRGMLNVVRDASGVATDNRLEEVQQVEAIVRDYLQSQFPAVGLELEIPPPDLRNIVGGARIQVNDGVKGMIESKGDGMKRAVLFALIRGIADLQKAKIASGERRDARQHYLFLFEEPELYLHPQAQRVLYDALVRIAGEHQVCVTTHSPYFFSADGTETFVRIAKEDVAGFPPASQARHVDLRGNVSLKDAFQILCFENNAAAFFCDHVVLIEGDSDLLFIKHVAKTLNPDWDFDARNIALIPVSGKGNFRRYREFFDVFGVRVTMIADLDALVDQFSGLGSSDECNAARSRLLAALDVVLDSMASPPAMNSRKTKDMIQTRTFADRWESVRGVLDRVRDGGTPTDEDMRHIDGLLSEGLTTQRAFVLKRGLGARDEMLQLIRLLREQGVHVWSKGAMEDYYPAEVPRGDKPSRAMSARELLSTPDHVLKCCPRLANQEGQEYPEFNFVFEAIFCS